MEKTYGATVFSLVVSKNQTAFEIETGILRTATANVSYASSLC